MRKTGKYEKTASVKGTLLRTYMTSLLSLVLCVSMFFGTSYAWFSSEVESTGNEIHVGILDADLLLTQADGTQVSLKNAAAPKVFSGEIRWEPGYTVLRTLTVRNLGNLAFDYVLTMKTAGDTAAAEYFDVWVYDDNTALPTVTAYSQISESSGWTWVGTLADVLAGETVFEGKMNDREVQNPGVEHTYTIALHMNGENDDAVNAMMGQSVDLSVKLVATQKAAGMGYDLSMAPTVSTFAELESAVAQANAGTVIVVDGDMVMDAALNIDQDVVLYFDDHTVSGASFNLRNNAGLTLSSAKSAGIDVAGTGTVVLEDMKVQANAEGDSALALAENADIKLIARGNNKLVGARNGDGIEVPGTAKLDLSGEKLTAVGNNGAEYAYDSKYNAYYTTTSDTSYDEKAGSGIGNGSGEVGAITIHDLESLTAKGYGKYAFGIGGNTASLTLTNTTVRYARGGMAREIPVDLSYAKEGNNGGAAIGSSYNGAQVTLNNVTVKRAEGGAKAAAIGAANYAGIVLTIQDSTLKNVVGGHSAAAIGGSRVHSEDATAVKIIISNSAIQARGGYFGAGIGSGYDTDCSGASSVHIEITGNSKIAAVGGARAAGIGTGYHTANLTGFVKASVDTTGTAAGDPAYYKPDPYTVAQAIGYGVVQTEREGADEVFGFDVKGTQITGWVLG